MSEATAEPSFFERKRAELSQESAPVQEETTTDVQDEPEVEPDDGYPDQLESAADDTEEALIDGDDAETDPQDTDPDGDPIDHSDESVEGSAAYWEKRFKDTQRQLSEATANRKEREREQGEIVDSAVQMRHSLEDTLTEAKQYATAYLNGFDQQIAQLQQAFNSGMISPDDLPKARQQYQALMQQKQNITAHVEKMQGMSDEAKALERDRKAEIARVRLSRDIPGWSRETYQQIGKHAESEGFSAEEFNELVDHRMIKLLYDSMQLNGANETVETVRSRSKAKQPKRTAREQPRSADGRYRKAKQDFEKNPGKRGSFANMKLAQLQRDRRSPR